MKGAKFMSNSMISAREALIPGGAYDKNKMKAPGRNIFLPFLYYYFY